MKADTHIHTEFSDGAHSVSEVVAKAVEHGCDVVAITDHADRNLTAATPEYAEAIEVARRQHPNTIIIAGLEWNIPPWGGDEHATVLVPQDSQEFLVLAEFKSFFDDLRQEQHDKERAASALRWLAEQYATKPTKPVIIYNHPSRRDAHSIENVADFEYWRKVNDLVIGFSGAPGHQAGRPLGAYTYQEKLIDRWDPAAARVGDAWDTLLGKRFDLWAARAPSDFHNASPAGGSDFWPGQFSETWLFVPERSVDGVLRAFRAGTFFAAHGHIVRRAELTVAVPGLARPAHVGEVVQVPNGAHVAVELRCSIPKLDWKGEPNRIDSFELIAITDEGAQIIAESRPTDDETCFREFINVPPTGIVLRGRGRRIEPDGPDLMFYTNPIRIITPQPKDFSVRTFVSQTSIRRALGILILGVAFLSLILAVRRRRHSVPSHSKPVSIVGVPQRRHYLLFVILWTAFIAYGSAVPLRFVELSWEQALSNFREILADQTGRAGRVDFGTNMLILVPVGFGWMAALLADRMGRLQSALAVPVVLALCAATSLSLEFMQVWMPTRVSSRYDVIAQMSGAVIGITLWLLFGCRITSWFRSYSTGTEASHRIDWLLKIYLAGLFVYSILPGDFSVHPVELLRKFRDGKILLVPFVGHAMTGENLWELLFDLLVYIPVGVLCTRLFPRPNRPVRPVVESTLIGAFIVSGVEFSQLFVMSRFTESADVITGTIGVSIGAGLMNHWQLKPSGTAMQPTHLSAGMKWMALSLLYLFCLCSFFWWPMEVSTETELIRERLDGFLRLPFHSLQRSSNLEAATQIIRKILLFALLGFLLARSVLSFGITAVWRRVLLSTAFLVAAGFGVLIELVQAAIPPHVPDVTDVLLYSLGTGLGMLMTVQITNHARPMKHRVEGSRPTSVGRS